MQNTLETLLDKAYKEKGLPITHWNSTKFNFILVKKHPTSINYFRNYSITILTNQGWIVKRVLLTNWASWSNIEHIEKIFLLNEPSHVNRQIVFWHLNPTLKPWVVLILKKKNIKRQNLNQKRWTQNGWWINIEHLYNLSKYCILRIMYRSG